jgi:polyhydroxyalkanoate synthesis regulator phasin
LYNQKELEILITEMKQLREENQLLKEKLGAIALRIETLPSDRDLVRSRDSGAVRRALEPLRQLIAEYDSVQNQLQR